MLQFMGDHPWLTFFLACIAGDTIIKTARAIFDYRKKPKPMVTFVDKI